MKLARLTIAAAVFALSGLGSAQTQAPLVVQAATAPAPMARSATQPAGASSDAALKALQAMKAANDELIRKQTATLQQLDEMEKAAAQIKIFTKRG